jgi:hypothetical protein
MANRDCIPASPRGPQRHLFKRNAAILQASQRGLSRHEIGEVLGLTGDRVGQILRKMRDAPIRPADEEKTRPPKDGDYDKLPFDQRTKWLRTP